MNNRAGRYLDTNEAMYISLTSLSSVLSIGGGVSIILVYRKFVDLQTPLRKLFALLSLADVLTATGNILGVMWYMYGDRDYLILCKLQSALTVFSSISSFLWTVIIGVCLLFTIVIFNPSFAPTYMKVFHIISWSLPAVIAVLALSMDVLGYDESLHQASWCWIDPRVENALFWQFFTGKFWEIVAYIATLILYTKVKVYLWKRSRTNLATKGHASSSSALHEANRKLTFVPLVFIVLRIWGTLRFLLGSFAHEYASSPAGSWIVPLQGIGDSAQGFANFILYCFFTEKIRNRLLPSCLVKKRRNAHTIEVKTKEVKRAAVNVLLNENSSDV
ncbi:hypothetical protein ScPMuIL_018860 [Solemya velum]